MPGMEERRCDRCKAGTLVGLSNGGRGLAQDVVLDPLELNPLGELDALHAGRRTWTRYSTGDVFARSTERIHRWPAGRGWRQTVHADHVCQGGQA